MTHYLLKIGGPVPQAGQYLALGTDGVTLLRATQHPAQAMRFKAKTTATRYRAKLQAVLGDPNMSLSICRKPEGTSR